MVGNCHWISNPLTGEEVQSRIGSLYNNPVLSQGNLRQYEVCGSFYGPYLTPTDLQTTHFVCTLSTEGRTGPDT